MVLVLPVAGRQPMSLSLTALLILGVLGTGFADVINFALIATEGVTGASVVTHLVLVTSALLGTVILAEPLAGSPSLDSPPYCSA